MLAITGGAVVNQKGLPEVSLIIPVYGAEQYLCPCIDSVLSQSYQNFELLLIDDGSLDRSGVICDEYGEKDSRIRVFHRTNHGVSSSRNFGIQQARGEYIAFIDADDLVLPGYIQKLYDAVSEHEKDAIAMCGFQLLEGRTLTKKKEPLSDYQKGRDSLYDLYLEPIITRKIHGSSCRILYPIQLLKNNRIIFPDCKIAEDQLFLMEVISHCQNVRVVQEPLYLYRQIEQSSSHCSYITNYLTDRLRYLQKLRQILEKLPMEEEQRHWLLSFSFQFCRMLVYMNATASPDFESELSQIDASAFSRCSISRNMKKRFSAQMGRKHRILNFLVVHRMFSLISLIRSHKNHLTDPLRGKASSL